MHDTIHLVRIFSWGGGGGGEKRSQVTQGENRRKILYEILVYVIINQRFHELRHMHTLVAFCVVFARDFFLFRRVVGD